MYKNRDRSVWLVPAIIIAIIILLVVLFASGVFTPGGNKQTINQVADSGQQALVDISENSSIRMTVRGKITADEVHGSYQITVRPGSKQMQAYQGYLENVVHEKTYGNNLEAYTEFSYALKRLGMMSGQQLDGDQGDVRGICPTGKLTTFEVLNGDQVVKSLWHTSCAKDVESFKGKYSSVEKLFKNQIVDYTKLLKGVKL